MPAQKKVSSRQMELLLAFAEENRDLIMRRSTRGPQTCRALHCAWESMAIKLNSVVNGIHKTGAQWRRYWIELKAKTKAKGANIRRHGIKTGSSRNKLTPLNEFEDRILNLIGRVTVEGLPEEQIPFESFEWQEEILPHEVEEVLPTNKIRTPISNTPKELVYSSNETESMAVEKCKILAKSIAIQLQDIKSEQLTIVNKIISDAIFYGKTDKLTVNSYIKLGSDDIR